ncbi:hypothetical protein [Paenibacillus chungangensis]|uniref:Uncharacterized protein n=1 Tax=Paenibacillus chungangensis TaxID=696535 RepID=A0ABW3HX17_9BACL
MMNKHSYIRKTKVIWTATLCAALIFTAAACNNDGSSGNAGTDGVNNESPANDAMVPDADGNAMNSLTPDAGTAE